MASPSRTWTALVNQAFADQADWPGQYREAIFQLSAGLIASGNGGSITRSSNGLSAADSNLWSNPSSIGLGTILGSQTSGAWQAGTLGANYGASVHFLLAVNATVAFPEGFQFRIATLPYTGGDASNLPTTAGVETQQIVSGNLIQWPTDRAYPGRWASLHSIEGDVIFLTKVEGTPRFSSSFVLASLEPADAGGSGRYRVAARFSATGNPLDIDQWGGGLISWSGLHPSVPASHVLRVGVQTKDAPWETSARGELPEDRLTFFWSSFVGGRVLGQHPDLHSIPEQFPFGVRDPSEDGQDFQRIGTGGGLCLFWPSGGFPVL